MLNLTPLLVETGFDASLLAVVIGVDPDRARALLAGTCAPTAVELRAIAAALSGRALAVALPSSRMTIMAAAR